MAAALTPWEKPTSDDVATLLRARTKDLDGQELGQFTDNTRPTGTEVDRIIDMAYAEVCGLSGDTLADACATTARWLTTLRAAMWVELSYWPEQVRSDRSVYAELAEQWTAGVPILQECVAGNLPDTGGGETNAGYRFGVLDVHGWTASPYYGAPDVGPADLLTPYTGPPGPPGPTGPAGPPGPPGPSGGDVATSEWAYATNRTDPPPNSGQVRGDALPLHTATTLWISTDNADGADLGAYLRSRVFAGQAVYVQTKTNADEWVRFNVTGDMDDQPTWVGVPVEMTTYGLDIDAGRVVIAFGFIG